MRKVSVYIPCYNAREHIKNCLESVFAQRYPIDEVLVIDDGSDDDTAKIAAAYPVKIIRQERNKGLAAARQRAMREARNEFVACLDADCVADQDWLATLVARLDDETVAAAGGMLVETHTVRLADQWRSVHMKQQWGSALLVNPPFLYGSNVVVKAAAVRQAGGYDERFTTNYEDVDMSRRLRASGFSLLYVPQAQVYHHKQDTLASVMHRYWAWTFFDLPIPDTKKRLAHKIFRSLRLQLSLMRKDIRAGRGRLLAADMLLFMHFVSRDFAYFRERAS